MSKMFFARKDGEFVLYWKMEFEGGSGRCYDLVVSVEELALNLSKPEKLKLMEALWNDLSSQPESMESPAWHEGVLKETEERLIKGEEAVVDWAEAKRVLARE